jgi:hypothetical protein
MRCDRFRREFPAPAFRRYFSLASLRRLPFNEVKKRKKCHFMPVRNEGKRVLDDLALLDDAL